MKIVVCEQYSPAWWAARRGVPTASEFGRIITEKKLQLAAAADRYICELVGDLYDPGYPRTDGPTNGHMREGTRREPESRKWYEFQHDVTIETVGFCLSDCGRFGCSPDGLVGEDGLAEFKNPSAAVQVARLLEGTVPADMLPQLHGQLIVTGRKWVDWVSYCSPLPALVVRVQPNDYTAKLRSTLEEFWGRLEGVKALVKAKEAA